MRVLHIYSGNLYGGIESMLVTLARCRELCPELEPAFALSFEGRLASELRAAGCPVHLLGEVRLSRPATVRHARASLDGVVQRGRFDAAVVHAPWSHAMFAGTLRAAGVPMVFWAHDCMTGRHWTERLARRVPPDYVVCNSAFTRSSLPTLFPNVAGVSVIHPPVEELNLTLTLAERTGLRASLQTPADAVVIVTACRSEAWKGHLALIESLAMLGDAAPNWVWWQVGGAQRRAEAQYLASLKQRAEQCGVASRVRWMGDRTDVPRLLRAADVYCQPNQLPEPFGIAFVEALAAGLPVVTTDFGGAREIVGDDCGVLVPAGAPGELAAALRRLVADASVRTELGRGGPARARTLCGPAARLRDIEATLAGVSRGAAAGATA